MTNEEFVALLRLTRDDGDPKILKHWCHVAAGVIERLCKDIQEYDARLLEVDRSEKHEADE